MRVPKNSAPIRLWASVKIALSLVGFFSAAAGVQCAEPSTNPVSLFNGKDLTGWAVSGFAAGGEVKVEDKQIIIGMGEMLTGVTLTNLTLLPHGDYEVTLEAKRIDGGDFFCGLTFPVAKSSCSLIVGGWGGGLVGLSSIDGFDASENSTTKVMAFDKNHWYHIRLRVTEKNIQCWIDQEQIIDVDIEGKRISLRLGEIYRSEPFGIATYQTRAAIRNLAWRPVHP